MKTVNVHEAKTRLSQLIEAVEAGEEIIIARAGRPIARLTQLAERRPIRFGVLKGKVPKRLLDDVVQPLSKDRVQELFGGSVEP